MIIDLTIYRQNKEVIKSFEILEKFFKSEFPEKSWGWVGMTALLFSQLAIENYLATEAVDPEFKPELKKILWQYTNIITNTEKGKDDRHE